MNTRTTDPELLEREALRALKDLGLPPCPAILTELVREKRRDDPDLQRVCRLVGADAALAGPLLQAANSPLLALARPAGTVQQALTLLGMDAGIGLVTGLLLRQAFPARRGPLMAGYWERSQRLQEEMMSLAGLLGGFAADEVQTYALFRDCGMAVMLGRYPLYEDIFEGRAADPGQPVTEVENERYLVNHARAGYELAAQWMLSEDTCAAIRRHHDLHLLAGGSLSIAPGALRLVALGLLAEQRIALRGHGRDCADWMQGEALARMCFGAAADFLLEAPVEKTLARAA